MIYNFNNNNNINRNGTYNVKKRDNIYWMSIGTRSIEQLLLLNIMLLCSHQHL